MVPVEITNSWLESTCVPRIKGMRQRIDVCLLIIVVRSRRVFGNDLFYGGKSPGCHIEIADQLIPGIETRFPGGKPGVAIPALGIRNAAQIAEREARSRFSLCTERAFVHKKSQEIGRA